MAKTRPIQREVGEADVIAAQGLAIHNAYTDAQFAPNVHPGLLVTNPELAGAQVKGQLGGGFFNPLNNKKYK